MSRRQQITNRVQRVLKNATHPPSETNLFAMIEDLDLNEAEKKYVKEIFPRFFGSTFGIYELMRSYGFFPIDILFLILDYRGEDKVDVCYGKLRSQGNQVRKLCKQGGAEVFSFASGKFEKFGPDPMENMLATLCLKFYIYYNDKLIYLKGKGGSGVDINEIWRLVSKFEITEEQVVRQEMWKNFVSQFICPPLPDIPYDLKISDDRPECEEICRELALEHGVPLRNVRRIHGNNKKIFLESSVDVHRHSEQACETIRVDIGLTDVEVNPRCWLAVGRFKKLWNPNEEDLSKFRVLLSEMFKNITVRWAAHLLKLANITEESFTFED